MINSLEWMTNNLIKITMGLQWLKVKVQMKLRNHQKIKIVITKETKLMVKVELEPSNC
jgi:hypothetical protein